MGVTPTGHAPAHVIDLPDPLRLAAEPHIPDFCFALDDLSHLTEDDLLARAQTGVVHLVMLALSLGRDGTPEAFPRLFSLFSQVMRERDGTRAVEAVMRYLAEVRDDDFIDVLVHQTPDPQIQRLAMSYKQRMIEQGMERGLEQGRVVGARAILEKLLVLKFGDLDDQTTARLAGASLEDLERWADRVLEATSIESVFDR